MQITQIKISAAMSYKRPFSLSLSMYSAFIGAIILVTMETVRRWNQFTDPSYFISWFDDYLVAAFLLFAAFRVYQLPLEGQRYLTAAWGAATGMMFMSFFGQLQHMDQPDPAPVSVETVVTIKGCLFLVALVSMILSLKKLPGRA